jgi:hypothetical protein
MKLCSILSVNRWMFVFSLVILCGCASQAVFIEEHGHEYVARHIDELREYMNSPQSYASKVKWKENVYPMADGYYGFVEPIGKDCAMHWTVNKRDKLVRYDAKGDGCDRTTKSDLEAGNLKSISVDDEGRSRGYR